MLPQSLVDLLPHSPAAAAGIDGRSLPTGVEALDATLSGGGLPRGRLTEVIGVRGSGKATLLRQIVARTRSDGGWVVYIDATRTLAPRDWAHLGDREGLWMIRPKDASRTAWCADVLLRCGAFALVVIDSGPVLSRGVAVRLTRLARESGAALVIAGEEGGGSLIGGAVRLHVRRERGSGSGGRGRGGHLTTSHPPPLLRERRMIIQVEKGGGGERTHRVVEVNCAIGVARRLCTYSEVPDRRGVARRPAGRPGSERRPTPVAVPIADRQPNESTGAARVLGRKRRCAEPEFAVGDLHAAALLGDPERAIATGTLG